MPPVSWDPIPVVDTGASSTPRSHGVAGLFPPKVRGFLASREWGEGMFPAQIAFISKEAAVRKLG